MRRMSVVLSVMLCLTATVHATDVTTLVKNLKAKDTDVRRQAAKELADMGKTRNLDADEARALKAAVPALLVAMKDNDVFVRRFATQALGQFGTDDSHTLPALIAALKDDKQVVEAAATALGKMGAPAVKPLADMVKDKNKDVLARKKGLTSLAEIGPAARDAVPVLVALLKDMPVRLEAALALGAIGPDARAAVEPLKAIVASRERDRTFKQACNTALTKINKGKK